MDERLRQMVRERARNRCEYCQLSQIDTVLPFEIEHIISEKHGGKSEIDNLALACRYCNAYKGPNIAGIDPTSEEIVPLFHPRRAQWIANFEWAGPILLGLSPHARATIAVLRINHPELVALRQSLLKEGVSFAPES